MKNFFAALTFATATFAAFDCFAADAAPAEANDKHVLPLSVYPYWGDYKKVEFDKVSPRAWVERDGVAEGWDWSLPSSVKPEEKSYVTLFRTWSMSDIDKIKKLPKINFPSNPVIEHWCYWRDIEKTEGVYNFQPLIDMIKSAAERGYGSVVRLHTGAVRFTPKWFAAYKVPIRKDTYVGDRVVSYDVSHPEFHKRYLKLVEELGKTGIPHMEEVKGLFVGYASPSNGDEGIGPDGVDPDKVEHVIERLDAWAAITKGVEHKMYMGGWSNYGISKGFGIRRGFVEMYLYHIPDSTLGQGIDSQGYLTLDENNEIVKTRVRNGDENEEYEDAWTTPRRDYRFGKNTDSFQYRYFTSCLRLLQMRCNYVLWNEFTLNPDLFVWTGLELGRTAQTAPDAWCFLRESYLKPFYMKKCDVKDPNTGLKNFERWLFQRDAKGYETEPAVKINHAIKMWMVDEKRAYDYVARRGAKIGFTADKNFLRGEGRRVAAKISYFDIGKGVFNFCFYENGKLQSRAVECNDTGGVKTSTFIVNADFIESDGRMFDITLEGAGSYKPTISLVRIVKL